MLLTFGLLGLAICLVWAPSFRVSPQLVVPLWTIAFVAACVSGLAYGFLQWPAIVALALLAATSYIGTYAARQAVRGTFTVLSALLALALAMHIVPGFANPLIAERVVISPQAAPYTQYANFDKGAAGLILLAFFGRRATSSKEIPPLALATLTAIAFTSIGVTLYALLASYVVFDPKIPEFALRFLAINLLFTCVAEEVFFRGLIQERLMQFLSSNLHWLAVVISSVLFGVAHFAGGAEYVVLATIAGIGYSLVYAYTRRIESAIVTHFGVNAVHFFGFTYPHLAR